MIELYKCEKCGKVFTDYDEANNCEMSHLQIDWWKSQDLNDKDSFADGYSHKGRLPREIRVFSREDWYEHDEETGKWKKRRFIGLYKLQDTECEEIHDDDTESPN